MKEITIAETKRMFDVVCETVNEGGSVNEAFSRLAAENGRSAGSVRSYYYAQLRLMRMLPELGERLGLRFPQEKKRAFERFTSAELKALIVDVLTSRVEGCSVRASLMRRAGSDVKKYVRYQNKYRVLVSKKRKEVYDVLSLLNKEKIEHYDPFTKKLVRFGSLDKKRARAEKILEGAIGDVPDAPIVANEV